MTPVSMSQGSYQNAGHKAPEGQDELPEPSGHLWLQNGVYPGWQRQTAFSMSDPRPAGPDIHEVGRGPLSSNVGRFRSIRLNDDGVELRYDVFGETIIERISGAEFGSNAVVRRWFRMERVKNPIVLAIGFAVDPSLSAPVLGGSSPPLVTLERMPDGLWVARVPESRVAIDFTVLVGNEIVTDRLLPMAPAQSGPSRPASRRWGTAVEVPVSVPSAADAGESMCHLETIPLPVPNPWRRNVRVADLAFDRQGRVAIVTFDGDVWRAEDIRAAARVVRWTRFTSGLHEPLGLAFREGELYVNDRNGIWRIRDRDGNGEADEHELFSNAFAQTAETREFATGIRVAPDGAFIISKGGQQGSTLGLDNGSVLRVAPDGRTCETLGWGLRMPFIGVHPRSGLVTASDQQGNYVPATPLHVIRDRRYYGYLSLLLPKEVYPAPISEPVTWIPHPVNASGAGQVWLTDANMGALNNSMIHIGYFRPELFVARWNGPPDRPRVIVTSLTRDLSFAPLNGAVNPADGQLYITGFQIWGTVARDLTGLARVRPTSRAENLPLDVKPTAQGILVRFAVPLDRAIATNPANWSVERWNYRRTAAYGSPHFRLDGSKGQETLGLASVHVSRDGQSAFLAIADLRPVMQMRVGWSVATRAGVGFASSAYFTPNDFPVFEPTREGFDAFTIDFSRPLTWADRSGNQVPATAEAGRRVTELMGCVACHSTDGTTVGKVGPTWKGMFGQRRAIAGQGEIVADEAYLRESILDPPAKVVRGFEKGDVGMPSYEGVLTPAQVDALVAYLKSL